MLKLRLLLPLLPRSTITMSTNQLKSNRKSNESDGCRNQIKIKADWIGSVRILIDINIELVLHGWWSNKGNRNAPPMFVNHGSTWFVRNDMEYIIANKWTNRNGETNKRGHTQRRPGLPLLDDLQYSQSTNTNEPNDILAVCLDAHAISSLQSVAKR